MHNGYYCLKNQIEINDGKHDLVIWGMEAGNITALKLDGEVFKKETVQLNEVIVENKKIEHNWKSPFKLDKKITTLKGVPIWQPISDYIMDELKGTFSFNDVCMWMNKYYTSVLKRQVKPSTIDRYACGYIEFLVKNNQIEEISNREYKKVTKVSKSIYPKRGNVPNIIKWLIEKNKKVFDLEEFFRDYPKSKQNRKRTEKVIGELIEERELTQLGNDRFKLNNHKIRVTDS